MNKTFIISLSIISVLGITAYIYGENKRKKLLKQATTPTIITK